MLLCKQRLSGQGRLLATIAGLSSVSGCVLQNDHTIKLSCRMHPVESSPLDAQVLLEKDLDNPIPKALWRPSHLLFVKVLSS